MRWVALQVVAVINFFIAIHIAQIIKLSLLNKFSN